MHQIEQRNIADRCRQEGVLHNFRIGNPDIFDHQEGGRAHHRRHDLAVDGGAHLDRPGALGREADPAHQRDRERTRGYDVGDGGTGNQAGHGRGQHRRLGRPTAQVAEQSEGELDEVVSGPALIEQGAEQHEEENEGTGDAERDAEHALRRQIHVAHGPLDRSALPLDHLGKGRRVTKEDIGQEDQGHDHQRWPETAARRLQQHHQADAGDRQIVPGRQTRSLGQRRIEEVKIGAAEGTCQRQHPVERRHAIARLVRCGEADQQKRQCRPEIAWLAE